MAFFICDFLFDPEMGRTWPSFSLENLVATISLTGPVLYRQGPITAHENLENLPEARRRRGGEILLVEFALPCSCSAARTNIC